MNSSGSNEQASTPLEHFGPHMDQRDIASLHEWNATQRELPADDLCQLFEKQVDLRPEAPAIVFGAKVLSYRELDDMSNQTAHLLLQRGVVQGELVALLIDRSIEMVVALLGILKAGAAYLPLDPNNPKERHRFMIEDAAVNILLTRFDDVEIGTSVQVIRVSWDGDQAYFRGLPVSRLPSSSNQESLAYVCYTSGSTGEPKGVMVSHRSVIRLVIHADYCPLGSETVILQAAPIAFDAATFEIWGALLNGGKTVLLEELIPDAQVLERSIRQYGVTTMFLTTALLNAVVDDRAMSLSGLSRLLFGGERVSVPHVRKLQDECPDLELIHVYGPTETTTFATAYSIRDSIEPSAPTIPIGSPIANTSVYILDVDRKLVPVGGQGEIYIGGIGVARGYLNRPELTEQHFVQDPFVKLGPARMYRTGDVGRYCSDGAIEFVGRVDHQVKIRGHRIELGEIEAALDNLEMVSENLVLCREDVPGEKRLVAYIVEGVSYSASDVRDKVALLLPDYMVPNLFITLGELPLTTNGKVDRQALPLPDLGRVDREEKHVAPRSEVERMLAIAWGKLLGCKDVGIDDNFFHLGGHSLLVMRLISLVRREFEVQLDLVVVFDTPTIRSLAPRIEASLYLREGERLLRRNEGGDYESVMLKRP